MSDSSFWNEDWMKTQKKYWDQWTEFNRRAAGMAQPQQTPWEHAMDHWLQAISPNTSTQSKQFLDKMLEQGKLFMRLGDSFMNNMEHTENWTDALEKTFDQLHQNMNNLSASGHDTMNRFMGFWQSPVENWQKMTCNMPYSNPEPMMESLNLTEKLLGAPSLGYSRELEEQYKQLMQAGIDYQKALLAYNNCFNDLPTVAVMRMKDRIQALNDSGKSIDSARSLYDHWVAVCEEAYAERVMTTEYTKTHGELINALMKVKNIWGELTDRRLSDLSIPTRREVRTLQDRLQESRREIRAMRDEIDSLKQQFDAPGKSRNESAAKPKPGVKKSVNKKPVARKASVKKSASRKN
jgi:class III poly(R)-hydroxyalkanoic acid synthase PhaE subunit